MSDSTASSYIEYTSKNDRKICNKMLKDILARGLSVSVNDGEEWTLCQSTNLRTIKDALGTTGEDTLQIFDANNKLLGAFWFIWNNGEDCPVSDYSSNALCDEIVNAAQ